METARAPGRLRRLPSWLISQAAVRAGRLVNEGPIRAASTSGALLGAGRARRVRPDQPGRVEPALRRLPQRPGGPGQRADRARLATAPAPDPDDRGCNVITLTPAGGERLRRLDRTLAGIQDHLLAPLTTDERAQLVRLLTRVLDHHGGASDPA